VQRSRPASAARAGPCRRAPRARPARASRRPRPARLRALLRSPGAPRQRPPARRRRPRPGRQRLQAAAGRAPARPPAAAAAVRPRVRLPSWLLQRSPRLVKPSSQVLCSLAGHSLQGRWQRRHRAPARPRAAGGSAGWPGTLACPQRASRASGLRPAAHREPDARKLSTCAAAPRACDTGCSAD